MNFSATLFLLQVQLSDVAQVFGVISSAVVAIAVVSGVVWFIFKGKSLESCKEDLTRAEKRIVELEKEAKEAKDRKLEAEVAKAQAETQKQKIEAELSETERKLRRSEIRETETEKLLHLAIGEIQRLGGQPEAFYPKR